MVIKAKIRTAELQDAHGIHVAHMKSIRELCSKDYSVNQITAWGGRPFKKDKWVNSICADCIWVVEIAHSIEGFCHLEICDGKPPYGELLGLYLTAKIAGQGIGRQLIKKAEEVLSDRGIGKMVTRSTLTAEGFYLSQGFLQSGKVGCQHFFGVAVECIGMEKVL